MTVPERMRFIEMTGTGGPEVLTLAEGPVPQPGAGEVLIRVAAAGVNRPDVLQRSGSYPPPPGASPVLGLEVSGTIAALRAGAARWKEGDEICALVPGGGYAEYCVAPAAHCLPVPRGLGLVEAAGLPETFFTVWTNVFDRDDSRRAKIFSCMAAPAASARPRSSSPTPSARASSRPPARRRNARSASNSAPSGRSITEARISSRFEGGDRRTRRRCDPRHGRRALCREEFAGARRRGTAGADRVSAGQQGLRSTSCI